MKISKDTKIDLFTRMVKVRTFEDDTNKIFMAGKEMPGFLHLSQGEDAMAAGTCANLRNKRCHLHHPPRPRLHHRQGR